MMYVRAVRGESASSEMARFINNMDGTITDTLTGLMWQQSDLQTPLSWENALIQLNDLLLGDHTDWRMPTREEIRSIVDYTKITPSIYINQFPDAIAGNYWTSTSHPFQNDHIWCVHFYNGTDNYQSKNNQYYSRAVRGGQDQSDKEKIVIFSPAQGSTWEKEKQMVIQWDHRDIGGIVEVSISRDGGSYELIGKTDNTGQYTWNYVTGKSSPNCALRIKPLNSPDKANIQSFFRIISTKMPVLEVSPTSKEVPPLSGTMDISIINRGMALMDWQAIVQESWLHIQNNPTGTNNYTLKILFDNNSGDSRTGHVVIKAPDAMYSPQTILINQKAGYPIIQTSPKSQIISSIDDTVIFTITNDGTTFLAWNATIQDTWLNIVGSASGTDTGQIVFRVDPNYGDTRTASVLITAPGAPNSPTTVTITQQAGYPILKVSPETQDIGAESGMTTVSVVNAGAGYMSWSAESLTDWLSIETGFTGINDGVIQVSYRANDSDQRTATLRISTNDGQIVDVFLKQRPGQPILMVTPLEHRVSGNEGIISISVENAGSGILTWSAVSNAKWLTILNDSSGIQEGIIRVKHGKNTGELRPGLITVSSSATSQTQTRVTVIQESLHGYKPEDWDYNPKHYQYQCMVVAVVYNNKKQPMVNNNDILAAFIDNECRGTATPQDCPFGRLYFLQIWSNTQNDPVSFQFFDSDSGTIFTQINETIIFSSNESFGAMYKPLEINISEVDFIMSLNKGWNWVSMNIQAKDMSLGSVLASINGQCQKVVSQEGFAEYYGEQYYGTISHVDPAQMYLLKMYNAQTLKYSGDPVYYDDIAIQLDNEWNWIGYLPYFEMDINIALSSLGSSANRIVGQNGFSEYSNGWWGGITTLKPTCGYQIHLSDSASLFYPRLEDSGTKRRAKRNSHRVHRPFSRFQYPSCLTIQLEHENTLKKTRAKDQLIAISETGEIRGMAYPQQVLDKKLFFLQVWLESQAEIITITYKPLSGCDDMQGSKSLAINAYDTRGDIESPLTLKVHQYSLALLIEILQILAGGQ
ncbi:MAG: hypothetical protein OMM_01281 [Candidatus Magnetoglobus multicellularis str. Araruama]|uniref:BACON domain-containing protein n=1 Tax=Candidatus Magnetoglobus multicellularis str. Araruama TaxID=890399 RepID=A0A1V1PDR5_9BACT|nr:MAG: hypothetical protein OMM_01281 [Candidatus Magnetoglobus multicellularis str. Araruama]